MDVVLGLSGSLNTNRLNSSGDPFSRDKINIDDPQRIQNQVDDLHSGAWEKATEIGAACLRGAGVAQKYVELGVGEALEEALPASIYTGDDNMCVRILQLTEALTRIVCDGHSQALPFCSWWFIPARRPNRRRQERATLMETYLERVLPLSDVDSLKQLWYSESFDPSWRDRKSDAEMLACSLAAGCSIQFLDFLVDPLKGCRANVNPESDRLGKLKHPLYLAGTASGVSLESGVADVDDDSEPPTSGDPDRDLEKHREVWSKKAVEILLDAGCGIDNIPEDALEELTAPARELILAEKDGTRISERLIKRKSKQEEISKETEETWRSQTMPRLFVALLRTIGIAKRDETKHRAMEVLSILIDKIRPPPAMDVYIVFDHGSPGSNQANNNMSFAKFMELLQSVSASGSKDLIALQITVDILHSMLRVSKGELRQEALGKGEESTDFFSVFCLSLCRFGVMKRILQIAETPGTAELTTTASPSGSHEFEPKVREKAAAVVREVKNRIVSELRLPEETLYGRSQKLMHVCTKLMNGDASGLDILLQMLNKGTDGGHLAPTTKAVEGPGNAVVNIDDGITTFEFEMSGLAGAIAWFLLAKDVEDNENRGDVVRQRMQQFLAVLPPPMCTPDDVIAKDADALDEAPLSDDEKDSEGGSEETDSEEEDGEERGEGSNARSKAARGLSAALGHVKTTSLHDVKFDFGGQPDGRSSNYSTRMRRSSTMDGGRSTAIEPYGEGLLSSIAEHASVKPSSSALYKLINLLQAVLTLSASSCFPVLNHDSPASSGGIRALINPIKIKLSPTEGQEGTAQMYPQTPRVSVNVLPLTPVRELELQVLRSVRITDPRYVAHCKRLVGCKILHGLKEAKKRTKPLGSPRSPMHRQKKGEMVFQIGVVLSYDDTTGAHLVQTFEGDQTVLQWILLAVRDYHVLERIFSAGQGETPAVQQLVKFEAGEETEDEDCRHAMLKEGDTVAVWWEGGSRLKPGWREAKVSAVDARNDCCDVVYSSMELMLDETLRPGDLVELVDDPELRLELDLELKQNFPSKHLSKTASDMLGEVARITSIRGDRVTTDGLGGHSYPKKMLKKVQTSSVYPSRRRPQAGDKVRVRSPIGQPPSMDNGSSENDEVGFVVEEDKSWRPFRVRLPNGTMGWYRARDLEVIEASKEDGGYARQDIVMSESAVPFKRMTRVEGVASMDKRHVFTVYIHPKNFSTLLKELNERADRPKNGKTVFLLNDRVEAKYAGRSRWYRGRIARVNVGGTYDIAYDDGDSERGVKSSLICHPGQGSKRTLSFDFRKVFPGSSGKVLFDALRREDSVLNTEYNFLTRGFLRQPTFYETFSSSLQKTGKGTFAQFQTRQQAEILYDRIMRLQSNDDEDTKVFVEAGISIDPMARPSLAVERDILAAFEIAATRNGGKRVGGGPPAAGSRAQVQVMYDANGAKNADGVAGMQLKWVSATIIGMRKAGEGGGKDRAAEDDGTGGELYTCVLDNGVVMPDVPVEQVRSARRSSRNFPFKSRERGAQEDGMRSPSALSPVGSKTISEANFVESVEPPEPVELSRQFTAFGHSMSYKRIQVETSSAALEDDMLDDEFAEPDDDDISHFTPPELRVEFVVSHEDGERREELLTLTQDAGEMSMFQALYQLFHSRRRAEAPTGDGDSEAEAYGATWDTEYMLQWRCKVLFPGDEELVSERKEGSKHARLLRSLPWASPEALATEVHQNPSLTALDFYNRMKDSFEGTDAWASRNGLEFTSEAVPSWAAINVAYASLCGKGLPEMGASGSTSTTSLSARSRRNSVIYEDTARGISTDATRLEAELAAVGADCGLRPSEHGSLLDALLILHVLYCELVETLPKADYNTGTVSSPALNYAFAKSLPWRNLKLSEQLRDQLADPLSIATRCFPQWCIALPRLMSFLFKTKDRQVHMRCTALGVSRAVAWLQDEVTGYKNKKRQLAQVTLEISGMFRGVPDMAKYQKLQDQSDRLEDELRSIEQEHCIGQLHQDLVKVNRDRLLKDADALMRQHMHQRSELVVQFTGETGAGDGVTVDFYASVAAELQRRSTNTDCPMWADRIDHGDTENRESSHLMQSRGLFPQPLLPLGGKQDVDEKHEVLGAALKRNERVVRRFRFLGRLMAKAFLDGKHVPLPLALAFFVLVKNRVGSASSSANTQLLPMTALGLIEGGTSEEGTPGSSSGRSLGLVATLYKWWKRSKNEDWEKIREVLDNADIRFTDPSQPALSSDSKEEPVQEKLSPTGQIDMVEGKEGESDVKEAVGLDNLEVPEAGCSQQDLNDYALKASALGYTQSRIEEEMSRRGISKMQRWQALKASQKVRTEIALEKAVARETQNAGNASVIASELVANGQGIPISPENLPTFLKTITAWWLEDGVKRQADAFTDGLRDVLGNDGSEALLHNFSPSELRKMLCGKEEVQWKDDDPLLGCLQPMGTYTPDSPPIRMLVKCLKKMNMKERSEFLSFVTSQPRVPLSGLPQIKVYPPMMECINGIEVVEDDPSDGSFYVGDEVELADNYADWDDAAHGPLSPGEAAVVIKMEDRANVLGWWYNLRALRRSSKKRSTSTSAKKSVESWFKDGDFVRTTRANAVIEEWIPSEHTIIFSKKSSVTGIFAKGQRIENTDPVLRVKRVLEQPEAIQMPPYLRPKATTCAKTIYLPDGYEDYKHMLSVFRGAFEDAKLGGMND